jgi:hypothetical protein
MTFTRFLLTASRAISKAIPTKEGYRIAVAVCVAALLVALPPTPLLAQTPTPIGPLNISFQIGPLATQLNITKPVAQSVTTPVGGSAIVFHSTLHVHVQDDTQTPAFNGDLVATGQAADPDTLVGGFLPAAIRVMQDLHVGMTFQQAAADAQAKTGVTVTFFEDVEFIEYAVFVLAMTILTLTTTKNANVAPTLGDQLSAIQSKMAAATAAIGISVPPCSTSGTTIP